MSYTLRPDDDECSGRDGYVTREPISLRRIAIGISIGGVILIALAGLPSLSRRHRPLPVSDGLSHSPELTCHRELLHTYADLLEAVDPVTHQRPIYPTTEQLFARLLLVDHWQHAALFAVDASVQELQAAGVGAKELCLDLNYGRTGGVRNPSGMTLTWQLALLDDAGNILGRSWFPVPTLAVTHCGFNDRDDLSTWPVLEPRLPDWPRVAVFNRPVAGAQSDG